MPNVLIRWRHIPGFGRVQVRKLALEMPRICSSILSIPDVRKYEMEEIKVKVDPQNDEMDVNIPPLRIEISAHNRPEQVLRKDVIEALVVDEVRNLLGEAIHSNGEVLLNLSETAWRKI